MKNKALIGSLALLTFVVFSGPAKATPLPPGTVVPIAPDDFSLTDFSGATLLGSVMTPFVTTLGTTSGTIQAAVFSDPTNVFGAGDLTFVYQIHNNAGSADSLF